jgi:hypothetical protein
VRPRLRIAGSAGSEPEEQPAPDSLRGPSPLPTARLVEDGGIVWVQFGDRRLRLADEDAARLQPRPADRPVVDIAIPADLEAAIESSRTFREMLMQLPGVVSVRGGYKFRDGRITRTVAVVVAVERKLDGLPAAEQVPDALADGTPTDVTVADPVERLEAQGIASARAGRPRLLIDEIQADSEEADALEAVPMITYTPPPGGSLAPVTGPMTVTCHVSPDAGWSVLRPFLEETDQEVTLGMYDFTAPHIYQAVRSLLRDSDVVWRQTLGPNESLPRADDVDSTKADDKPEAHIIRGLSRVARDRFASTFAHVGAGKTFASAYHIKVAVRDRSAFWLSSGNWQSSNQPAIDLLERAADRKLIARFNREWHVVIENPALAATFELYVRHDFQTAAEAPEAALEAAPAPLPDLLVAVDELLAEERAAVGLEVFAPARFTFSSQKPLTVQPILTPDNYVEIVLDLLRRRPTERLYFQNQSLNPVKAPTAAWAELLGLLASYSNDEALDVRIIFRNIGPIRAKLESLQAAGFNMDRIRVQSGCHTKGIVIDSAKVLLGSHNWTNQGVEANRDASVLIENPEIAAYYERVFLHDWERLARPAIREEAIPFPVIPSEEAAAADDAVFLRIPWSAWEEE